MGASNWITLYLRFGNGKFPLVVISNESTITLSRFLKAFIQISIWIKEERILNHAFTCLKLLIKYLPLPPFNYISEEINWSDSPISALILAIVNGAWVFSASALWRYSWEKCDRNWEWYGIFLHESCINWLTFNICPLAEYVRVFDRIKSISKRSRLTYANYGVWNVKGADFGLCVSLVTSHILSFFETMSDYVHKYFIIVSSVSFQPSADRRGKLHGSTYLPKRSRDVKYELSQCLSACNTYIYIFNSSFWS
jgi:hypothetical protein